jgi:Family of unknown function (DUF5681)
MSDASGEKPNDERRRIPGRFRTGQSGNPQGRPAGSRNKATLAAEAMLEGEAEELTRKVLELAREGDLTALKLCLDRILPARRERPIQVDLPRLEKLEDAPAALASVINAVAAGELTLGEANEVAKLIDMFVRSKITVEKDNAAELKQEWDHEKRSFEEWQHRRAGFQTPPFRSWRR